MDKNTNLLHQLKIISGIVALFIVIIFTLQNSEIVIVNFLFWKFSLSRVLLMFVVFIAGLVVGYVMNSLWHHHRK